MSPTRVANAKKIYMNGLIVCPNTVAIMMLYSLFLQTYDQKNAIVEIPRILLEIQVMPNDDSSNYSNAEIVRKSRFTRHHRTADKSVAIGIRFLKFYVQKGVEQEMEMQKRGHDSLGIIDWSSHAHGQVVSIRATFGRSSFISSMSRIP